MTNRNALYALIGALIVVVAVLGYSLYQAKQEPKGLNINIGPGGVQVRDK